MSVLRELHSGRVILHSGDCLDVLDAMDADSIDSVVCDPPYHLASIVKRFGADGAAPAQHGTDGAFARAGRGFMGKQWDGGDIAFRVETWAKVLRVLKPGGYLAAFGGTRGWHRMACAIEDAGFEIRDSISYLSDGGLSGPLLWTYGSGFPKSHDPGKKFGDRVCSCGVRPVKPEAENGLRSVRGIGKNPSSKQTEEAETGVLRVRLPSENGDGAANWSTVATGRGGASSRSQTAEQRADEPETVAGQPESQIGGAWPHCERCGKPIVPRGLGTALKPAWEPICIARKPLSERNVADNILKWGTGAVNIDACRVAGPYETRDRNTSGGGAFVPSEGRWPANLVHDGSPEVLAAFPEQAGGSGGGTFKGHNAGRYGAVGINGNPPPSSFGDSGSAARFFYAAKADSDDRLNSKHPTVKPLDLMRWLVRLVTPKGGVCLDPFAGTGTTGHAALIEGMRAILIEREPEYQADIVRRMDLVFAGPDEKSRKLVVRDDGPMPLFGGAL